MSGRPERVWSGRRPGPTAICRIAGAEAQKNRLTFVNRFFLLSGRPEGFGLAGIPVRPRRSKSCLGRNEKARDSDESRAFSVVWSAIGDLTRRASGYDPWAQGPLGADPKTKKAPTYRLELFPVAWSARVGLARPAFRSDRNPQDCWVGALERKSPQFSRTTGFLCCLVGQRGFEPPTPDTP